MVFRCDHAGHEIPLYFWEEATAAVDAIKDVFLASGMGWCPHAP